MKTTKTLRDYQARLVTDVCRAAEDVLVEQPTGDGAAAREAIQQEVARRLRIDPLVKEAMAAAFAVVLEEFRDMTLNDSAVLESVGRQVHGMSGGQMQEFAQRLRDAVPKPLTEEQILKWADSYCERNGQWPMIASGAITDAPGESWANIDASLK